ncbi:uncharacterized protein PG998_001179 [Apiospora kogelbergensis]|uniref:uncharacterized protein n=1 Tax=Apiospora kogelbergensis TaxID=1337665 RepID=UPI00312EF8C6
MAQEAAKTPKRSSPIKTAYLILYNAVSAILWATVLGRTVGANMLRGAGIRLRFDRRLCALDADPDDHGCAARALWHCPNRPRHRCRPSRVPLRRCLGVQYPFPALCASPVYSSMLFAWSVTEVIRYTYLAVKLGGYEPAAFTWVRYSSYLVLYPLGITSEMIQMWRALAPAGHKFGPLYQLFLGVSLFVIWPIGAYVLIGHMNRQRRKVLAAQKSENMKATQ